MWKSLPIQTKNMRGDDYAPIDRTIVYERFPDVIVKQWKDVTPNIRQWCQSIWKEAFGTSRSPLNDADLVGWIPTKGTIVARYGHWIGESRSRNIVYVNCLYVSTVSRGEGLAKHLILSVSHEAQKIWGNSIPFFFEVDKIPDSLLDIDAQPICRYRYSWIPFYPADHRKWKQIKLTSTRFLKGFHGKSSGFRLYQNTFGDKILFDCNDDIVWYTYALSLASFDGFPAKGAYCRIFCSTGESAVFAENMYFTPSYGTHYLLG